MPKSRFIVRWRQKREIEIRRKGERKVDTERQTRTCERYILSHRERCRERCRERN